MYEYHSTRLGAWQRTAILTVFTMIMALAQPIGTAGAQTGTFVDDDGNIHEANIETLAELGITEGCNPTGTEYCPDQPVLRGQMAAFIDRALDLDDTNIDYFVDDNGSIFEQNINNLAAASITFGCDASSPLFCPDEPVLRGQMAAFIDRAFDLQSSNVDRFLDDEGSIFEQNINNLAATGITLGCNEAGSLFCPDDRVLRDQMASFIVRALATLGVTPPGGGGGGGTPPANNPPVADDDAATTTAGTSVNIAVLDGDTDADGDTLTVTAVSDPANGATVIEADNTVTYTPDAGFDGVDTFTYTVSDGRGGSDTGTVTVTVNSAFLASESYGIYVDGAEETAPLYEGPGSENEPAVVSEDTPLGIRFVVANTGTASATVQPKLQYRYIDETMVHSSWTDVTAASERVRAVDGAMTDGEPTVERLAGPATFVAGSVDEVNGVIETGVTLAAGEETEFVFSVEVIGADSDGTDQYDFRLVDVTTSEYDSYRFAALNTGFFFAHGFDAAGVADGDPITTAEPDPDAWSAILPGGGLPEYDSEFAIDGFSALFDRPFDTPHPDDPPGTPSTPPSFLRLNDINQARDLYGEVYLRFADEPLPNSSRIVEVNGGYELGDTLSHSIDLLINGSLQVRAGVGDDTQTAVIGTVSPNTWYRIEWHATTETAGGLLEVHVFEVGGAEVGVGVSVSGWPTLTEFEDVEVGPRSEQITAWIDEVRLSNQPLP